MNKQITVPICLGFDMSKVVGFVTIEKKYAKQFPDVAISPAFVIKKRRNDLLHFGLITAENYANAILNDPNHEQ